MKLLRFFGIILFAAFLFAACESGERKNDMRADDFESERSELREDINESIAKIDGKLTELKNDAETAGEDSKDAINRQISILEEKREGLSDKLDELGTAAEDNWSEFKNDVNESLESVDSAFSSLDVDFNT